MTILESVMLADISLFLQILALIVLTFSIFRFKRGSRNKADIDTHGKIASIAFILVLITVMYMAYSVYYLIQGWLLAGVSFTASIILVFLHGILGAVTIVFAVLFVANRWRWKTIGYMRFIAALWMITFLGGVAIYTLFYL